MPENKNYKKHKKDDIYIQIGSRSFNYSYCFRSHFANFWENTKHAYLQIQREDIEDTLADSLVNILEKVQSGKILASDITTENYIIRAATNGMLNFIDSKKRQKQGEQQPEEELFIHVPTKQLSSYEQPEPSQKTCLADVLEYVLKNHDEKHARWWLKYKIYKELAKNIAQEENLKSSNVLYHIYNINEDVQKNFPYAA